MSTALEVVPHFSSGALMPVMSVQQASERYNVMVEFTKSVMVKDQDFGVIPGVAKPCLYKAGAEKLSSLFGFTPCFQILERTEDWTGKDHGEPFFYYFYKCQLVRGGEIVGEGDGSCNSWEKKYRYRSSERKCPHCGKATIIAGKPEYERDDRYKGGFICFAKKGGCGQKFMKNDALIVGQELSQVPNPDVAETVNTLQKMAQKRSLVAAILIACNASAFYTQDVEDMHTIDVDYTETAQEVAERKIRENNDRRKSAGQAPITAPNPPSEDPPMTTPEQRHTALVMEANAVLDQPASKTEHKRGDISFKALAEFKTLKKELRDITGTDQMYYDALKASGVEHADGLSTVHARNVYKQMAKIVQTLKQDKALRTELEGHCLRIGAIPFVQALGSAGYSDLEEVIANATGDQVDAILRELRTK